MRSVHCCTPVAALTCSQHGRICDEMRGPYLWQLHKVKGSDVTFNPRPDSKLDNAFTNQFTVEFTLEVICFMLLAFRIAEISMYIKKPSQTCAGAV